MKTIEEKAYSHVDKIFSEIIDKYQTAPWNEFREALAQIYLAGAKEALAGQWRSVDDKLPEIDDVVFVTYPNLSTPLDRDMGVGYYDGEDWYTTDDTHIRPTHWMPIPEPPKTDKK